MTACPLVVVAKQTAGLDHADAFWADGVAGDKAGRFLGLSEHDADRVIAAADNADNSGRAGLRQFRRRLLEHCELT